MATRELFNRLLATLLAFPVMALGANLEHRQPAKALQDFLDHRSQIVSGGSTGHRSQLDAWRRFQDAAPVTWDWILQDGQLESTAALTDPSSLPSPATLLTRVLGELRDQGGRFRNQRNRLIKDETPEDAPSWWRLYEDACLERRAQRLEHLNRNHARWVFIKRHTIRPSFFAYTEGQSDAQNERHFLPGSSLCLLELSDGSPKITTLLDDPTGVFRDPAVSWDGQRVVFAWKKSLNEDDYHLYELRMPTGEVRPLTSGLGFADYEPAFLPSGDLVFSSTRCVQTVDCWWTEVSNLYTCGPEGQNLRRLGFDQVHAISPSVLDDGRIVYTRWDYNDRGQIYPQALFQMNPDGTGQAEFYGNNSWFPTTLVHARGIPGTQRVLATFCGHHTAQAGKLGILDPALGRQENQGAQLVAPVRPTPAERIDAYGQQGELFRYPFPFSESEFLVTYAPLGWAYREGHFGVYWMNLQGRRELLASDPEVPCHQPVLLESRRAPPARPSQLDLRKTHGTCYVQDVYQGPGLQGIEHGTIQRLRVVALNFRAAGVGNNSSRGPGGGALVSTPVAVGNGSWDVKVILGDARVYPDGSAFFKVPARTPFYLQALDERGYAVQTMRSWTTLQPGENASCIGCHESKNSSPPATLHPRSQAVAAGAQDLAPFHGPPRGFSFTREIQPILDRHCTRCHNDQSAPPPPRGHSDLLLETSQRPGIVPDDQRAFSLLGDPVHDPVAKRYWSDAYLALTGAHPRQPEGEDGLFTAEPQGHLVHWLGSQSAPEPLPPRYAGAVRSKLMALLENHHQGVDLSQAERETVACWIDLLVPFCGDYTEANAWSAAEQAKYEHFLEKRRRMETLERASLEALKTPR